MYFIFYISFVRTMTKFNFIFPGGRTINHINTNKDKDVCRWLDSIYNLFPSQSKPTESLSFSTVLENQDKRAIRTLNR